jgi:hypothetical protein
MTTRYAVTIPGRLATVSYIDTPDDPTRIEILTALVAGDHLSREVADDCTIGQTDPDTLTIERYCDGPTLLVLREVAVAVDDPRFPTPDELIAVARDYWNRYCQEDGATPLTWDALTPDGRANRMVEIAQYADILANHGFEVVRVAK